MAEPATLQSPRPSTYPPQNPATAVELGDKDLHLVIRALDSQRANRPDDIDLRELRDRLRKVAQLRDQRALYGAAVRYWFFFLGLRASPWQIDLTINSLPTDTLELLVRYHESAKQNDSEEATNNG